jgi:glycosyltransferase involved in cell wall biosynthesis
VLLWREWGDQAAALRALQALMPPSNVRIEYLAGRHMSAVYHDADAVACVYADGFGKSCPNSLVEGLACGVPAIVADTCGIAGLIVEANAGIAVPRDPRLLAAAVNAVRAAPAAYGRAARAIAELRFEETRFLAEYARLYRDVHTVEPRATRRFAA